MTEARSPHSFPRAHRLTRAGEFSAVFAHRTSVGGESFVVSFKPNGLGHPRLGLVMGKKTAPRAVDRNYAKRQVREVFRRCQDDLGGLDIVVRLRRPLSRAVIGAARAELAGCFERIARRQRAS